jgi:hypothetical protein
MTVTWRANRRRWTFDFRVEGQRHSGYCLNPDGTNARTKAEAKAAEAVVRARIRKGQFAPSPTQQGLTWAEALAAYGLRKKGLKDWEVNKVRQVRELLTWFGPGTPLHAITEQRVWEYIDWARAQPIRIYVGGGRKAKAGNTKRNPDSLWRDSDRTRGDATINRYLVVLREALAIATTLRDTDGNRALLDPPKVPYLDEGQHLPRPIPDDVLDQVIQQGPPHLSQAATLVRHMGFRKAEVFGLTVEQVDMGLQGVWLAADQTKGNRAEFIPANNTAWSLLVQLVTDARADNRTFLIGYRHRGTGPLRPVKNPRKAWNSLMEKLGHRYRWHDTKASFVTAVGQKASGPTTQALARHRDFRTTQRYLAVLDETRRQALDAISRDPTGTDTPPAESTPAPQTTDGQAAVLTRTLMTKSDYARRHGVTIDAVTYWIRKHWIPAEAISGSGRTLRIAAELADAGLRSNPWITRRKQATNA